MMAEPVGSGIEPRSVKKQFPQVKPGFRELLRVGEGKDGCSYMGKRL